jgi:endogenous inhibitor of DNA gyrase (YacG/DUF329 family)
MSASAKPRAARPCPICGKPSVPEWEPFCSPRCKDVDLHRWLSGSYAIPAVEADEPDDGEGEGLPPAAAKH